MLWTAGITIIACALERWSLSVESVVLAKYPFRSRDHVFLYRGQKS